MSYPQVNRQNVAKGSRACVMSLQQRLLASTSPGQRGLRCHPVLFAIQLQRMTILKRNQNESLNGGVSPSI